MKDVEIVVSEEPLSKDAVIGQLKSKDGVESFFVTERTANILDALEISTLRELIAYAVAMPTGLARALGVSFPALMKELGPLQKEVGILEAEQNKSRPGFGALRPPGK